MSDVFNSRKSRSINYSPNIENPTSISNQEWQWRVRQISLNFTYRFNQKKREQQKRNSNDFEEGVEFGS